MIDAITVIFETVITTLLKSLGPTLIMWIAGIMIGGEQQSERFWILFAGWILIFVFLI